MPTASSSCATARLLPPTAPLAFDRDRLVAAMGGVEQRKRAVRSRRKRDHGRDGRCGSGPGRRGRPTAAELIAHEGEIIGLAGLAGHGQTRLLLADLRRRHPRQAAASRSPRRWRWSPATARPTASSRNGRSPQNIGIRSLARLRNGLLISPAPREQSLPSAGGRQDRHPHARH